MGMPSLDPAYLKRKGGVVGHTLSDAEYEALLAVISRDLVLHEDGTIYTTDTGEIYYE